jgi:multidrug efflux pump subunit AcrA (membrane-fusion protein)
VQPRALRKAGIIFVVVVAAVVAYGLVSRAAENSRLQELTEAQAIPNVAVDVPGHSEGGNGIDLPGRLEAFVRAPIYARVPGYLKSWK